MNVSIDMVRLQVNVYTCFFEEFCRQYFTDNPDVYFYNGFKINDYHDNFKINEYVKNNNPFDRQDCYNKFWVGFHHNAEQNGEKHKYSLVIEFNPNKCYFSEGLLNKILSTFFMDLSNVYLKSVDIAFDLYVPITNFLVDKCTKHYFCDIVSDVGRTFYIGSPGSNGRVKIYDKAAEQKLDGVDWTRWEITIKFSDVFLSQILLNSFDFDFNVPDVFYFDELNFNDFDVKMRCYIYSVLNGFVKFNEFSRKIREKIKQTLLQSASIKRIDVTYKPKVYITIISFFKDFVNEFIEIPDNILKNIPVDDTIVHAVPLAPVLEGKQLSFDTADGGVIPLI